LIIIGENGISFERDGFIWLDLISLSAGQNFQMKPKSGNVKGLLPRIELKYFYFEGYRRNISIFF